MSIKINLLFLKKLKIFGSEQISSCFNCGNCTAVCALSTDKASFPRKVIRLAQLGAEKELNSAIEPWLCTYCGECSATCPRQAYPGEFMMSLRRYIISKYDITGLSSLFYRLPILQNLMALIVFSLSLWVFLGYKGNFEGIASSLEMLFPAFISLIIVAYLVKMYKNTIWDRFKKLYLSFSPSVIKETLIQILKQMSFISCGKVDLWRGGSHLLVVTGYLTTLFISIFHILSPLGKQYVWTSPEGILVFYATFAVLAGGLSMVARRMVKGVPSSMFSKSSDWLFVGMLVLVAGSTLTTYLANILSGPTDPLVEILFKLNLALEMAWIFIVVPFTKWIHIFLRPFAIYLHQTIIQKEPK